jgi:hypothetical protein
MSVRDRRFKMSFTEKLKENKKEREDKKVAKKEEKAAKCDKKDEKKA